MADFKNIKVSSRYATALFEVAKETDQIEQVKLDMEYIYNLIQASREVLIVFRNPIIHISKKISIINALFEKNVSELTLKFLVLITRKARIICLEAIANAYNQLYNKFYNIKTVHFETAVDIDKSLKDKIVKMMKLNTDSNIDLKLMTNPFLIGGFRLKYEDFMYDASIEKKLKILRKEFEKNIYKRKI